MPDLGGRPGGAAVRSGTASSVATWISGAPCPRRTALREALTPLRPRPSTGSRLSSSRHRLGPATIVLGGSGRNASRGRRIDTSAPHRRCSTQPPADLDHRPPARAATSSSKGGGARPRPSGALPDRRRAGPVVSGRDVPALTPQILLRPDLPRSPPGPVVGIAGSEPLMGCVGPLMGCVGPE
jgi:hypothetical protein